MGKRAVLSEIPASLAMNFKRPLRPSATLFLLAPLLASSMAAATDPVDVGHDVSR